jgi:hypothetical protein
MYNHPCAIKGCTNTIPWHIGDYRERKDVFKIWCSDHITLAPRDAIIFISMDKHDNKLPLGKRIAVVGPCTISDYDTERNIIEHDENVGNHPNISDWEVVLPDTYNVKPKNNHSRKPKRQHRRDN